MQSRITKIVTLFLIILIVLGGVYIYFSVRPTNDDVTKYERPALAIPSDILSSDKTDTLKDYTPNQPVPFKVPNSGRSNPFGSY
jgi:hypothetical protein